METTRTIETITVYWDSADAQNEGWASRVRWDDGSEVSESYDGPHDNPAEAVMQVAHEHGLEITTDDVACEAVEGGYAVWTAPEVTLADCKSCDHEIIPESGNLVHCAKCQRSGRRVDGMIRWSD
jgi:hypothetical protein